MVSVSILQKSEESYFVHLHILHNISSLTYSLSHSFFRLKTTQHCSLSPSAYPWPIYYGTIAVHPPPRWFSKFFANTANLWFRILKKPHSGEITEFSSVYQLSVSLIDNLKSSYHSYKWITLCVCQLQTELFLLVLAVHMWSHTTLCY